MRRPNRRADNDSRPWFRPPQVWERSPCSQGLFPGSVDSFRRDDLDWPGVATALAALSDDRVARIKANNRAAFDRLLAPEKVAGYFIGVATS